MSKAWSKQSVSRVEAGPGHGLQPGRWPDDVPAVRQLMTDGLDLPAGVTFLVGENGSGKSTLVEAIADAFGLDPQAGSPNTRHRESPADDRCDLAHRIRLHRPAGASRWGFFLRAETMHSLYTLVDALEDPRYPTPLHERSHGESFLEVLHRRFNGDGFYVLDEPEAALSFNGTLQLLATLHEIAGSGRAQVLCATHSPILASLPGATILQLDDEGWHVSDWADLELVAHWRGYLASPERYLRHLLTPPTAPG